jgi:phosphoglycolate phosphatase
MSAVRAVVFDLDGTLVQTRVASWEVFEPISRRHGLGVDAPEQYFELFRGNVFTSIRGLCSTDEQARAATTDFLTALRAHYAPPLVPGMHAVVRRLAAECTLAVMSSNAMEVLRRVLVDNELAYCFAHVFGGDVAPDKRTALRGFLTDAGSGYGRRCSADYDEAGEGERPDPSTTVLVTDTAGDVRDARRGGRGVRRALAAGGPLPPARRRRRPRTHRRLRDPSLPCQRSGSADDECP